MYCPTQQLFSETGDEDVDIVACWNGWRLKTIVVNLEAQIVEWSKNLEPNIDYIEHFKYIDWWRDKKINLIQILKHKQDEMVPIASIMTFS